MIVPISTQVPKSQTSPLHAPRRCATRAQPSSPARRTFLDKVVTVASGREGAVTAERNGTDDGEGSASALAVDTQPENDSVTDDPGPTPQQELIAALFDSSDAAGSAKSGELAAEIVQQAAQAADAVERAPGVSDGEMVAMRGRAKLKEVMCIAHAAANRKGREQWDALKAAGARGPRTYAVLAQKLAADWLARAEAGDTDDVMDEVFLAARVEWVMFGIPACRIGILATASAQLEGARSRLALAACAASAAYALHDPRDTLNVGSLGAHCVYALEEFIEAEGGGAAVPAVAMAIGELREHMHGAARARAKVAEKDGAGTDASMLVLAALDGGGGVGDEAGAAYVPVRCCDNGHMACNARTAPELYSKC